ncbi:cytochrome P450 704C1-like [Phragmites australis]|uniref:cytochrome P450 704C1-like n=1 Tax=Phragmites australis TaxID=29695 RepID=UPI002D777E63|nr:cytochrome P450 704C1-like [Phragmites australis]
MEEGSSVGEAGRRDRVVGVVLIAVVTVEEVNQVKLLFSALQLLVHFRESLTRILLRKLKAESYWPENQPECLPDKHKAREDILSRFIILLASNKDPETMNDHYLRHIVLNFLIAGKDTTGNILSWFFYMLCKNPIVQDKVTLEIKKSVQWAKEDNNTEGFTARLNQGAIDKMHYFHAAISETLRLYPAVPVVQINSL